MTQTVKWAHSSYLSKICAVCFLPKKNTLDNKVCVLLSNIWARHSLRECFGSTYTSTTFVCLTQTLGLWHDLRQICDKRRFEVFKEHELICVYWYWYHMSAGGKESCYSSFSKQRQNKNAWCKISKAGQEKMPKQSIKYQL